MQVRVSWTWWSRGAAVGLATVPSTIWSQDTVVGPTAHKAFRRSSGRNESTQSPRTLGTRCGFSPTALSQVLRKMGDFVSKEVETIVQFCGKFW